MIKNRRYRGDEASVWSLGIVLYMMIYGNYPFWQSSYRKKPLTFPSDVHVGALCLDLMTKLLQTRPEDRIPLRDVHSHPWLVHP